jgi:hypothetical protein
MTHTFLAIDARARPGTAETGFQTAWWNAAAL